MMKKILIVAAAMLCVVAIAIIMFNGANSTTYSGDTDNETMSLAFNDSNFTFTHEVSVNNSYEKTISIYEGMKDGDTFTVNKITYQTKMFGKLVSEIVSDGLSKNLSEYCFICRHNGSYVINDIPLTVKGSSPGKDLAYVTSVDQYENHTVYTTVLKGSSKADLASLGIMEIYDNGNTVRYEVTSDSYGDIDLDTCGIKKVNVTYGDGKKATVTVEVVDFICTVSPIEPGTTLNQALQNEDINIIPSGTAVTSPNWDSSKGDRMVTLVSESGYSKDIYINFVSSADKEVVSYELHDFRNYIEVNTSLPSFTFDLILKNGITYSDISSNDATVTGYDRHTAGPQVLTIYYDNCAFNVAIYVYSTEQSIPIAAKLVNSSLTPHISDSTILYDKDGIVFSEYSVEVERTNGVKDYIPLTKEMIETKYDEWIEPGESKDIPCTLHCNIENFNYYEEAVISYDPLEQNVKDSLAFSNIMGDCERISYTVTMRGGSEFIFVSGYDSRGLYLTGDLVTSSMYESKYLVYNCTEGVNSFEYYMGTVEHPSALDQSLIKNAVMNGKTHTQEGIYTVSFHIVIDEEFVKTFPDFGLNVGDEFDFYVLYDYFTGRSSNLTLKSESTISKLDITYDPADVHYSAAVENFMKGKNTVVLTVKYADDTKRMFDVVIGTKDFTFVCDEGYGLFWDKEGTRPYSVPASGINVSLTLYYV